MEGFGINTNLLETNVLNLTVVIGVLWVVGKDVLSSLLTERKRKIVQTLQDVENRFQDAQLKLEKAKKNLSEAQAKAKVLQSQSRTTAEETRKNSLLRGTFEVTRLEETKKSTLDLEKQKLRNEMRSLLTAGALQKAVDKMKQKKSSSLMQKQFVDLLITKLSFNA